jgi:S-adenosylmethionine:tRNA ribosyltransferase-isomerase
VAVPPSPDTMLVRDFDFELPDDLVAQRPAPRGESRLLVLDAAGEARHRSVRDLAALLRPGDLLVVNDTRVIPARLFGRRLPGGGRVEVLLAERQGDLEWDALLKPGKRARPGTILELATGGGPVDGGPTAEDAPGPAGLHAEVLAHAEDGRFRLRFSSPVEPWLDRLGHVPLPPYVKRPDEPADRERYQTVYAAAPGAIAAPTAGLHFDDALLAALASRGVERVAVTLHVGLGTFKPVTATLVHEHVMDAERYEVPASTAAAIAAARREGRRVVAVGTTVVRTLESAALAGGGQVEPGGGSTRLFAYPGFRFQVVDALLTNFHLPQSTLLMLVCAFAGTERVLAAYREAVAAGYRFYSYGDAMLTGPAPDAGPARPTLTLA